MQVNPEEKNDLPAHRLKSETEPQEKSSFVGSLAKVAIGGWIAYTSFVGHKQIFNKFRKPPGGEGKAI
jgi:hypothetical protein